MDFALLMPQIITAVATLGGVVLTLVITGRRERMRTEQMLAFERERILADDRRALFVRTAQELQRMRELLQSDREALSHEGEEEAWSSAVTERADTLFDLETALRLIAPSVAEAVRSATNAARSLRDSYFDTGPTAPGTGLDAYSSHTRSAMDAMRALLGT